MTMVQEDIIHPLLINKIRHVGIVDQRDHTSLVFTISTFILGHQYHYLIYYFKYESHCLSIYSIPPKTRLT